MSGVAGQNGRRGVRGDQGGKGATGERGESGDRGVTGERGPKGDHGQDGQRGITGEDGVSSPYLGRAQTLVLFAFVVASFVLLAWRNEVNSHALKVTADRQAASNANFRAAFIDLCRKQQNSDQQATAFRQLAHDRFLVFAEQERINPFISGDFRAKRVGNWVALADAAQLAADAKVKADCEAFR